MGKPMSMSVKEYLIRTLAVKLAVNEKTIEAVVNHQFQSANEAMDLNHSVEISGFGKFMFNEKKALKKLAKLESKREYMQKVVDSPETTEALLAKTTMTLNKTIEQINVLKPTITHD
jgi:nucleoid DNA-binding protein